MTSYNRRSIAVFLFVLAGSALIYHFSYGRKVIFQPAAFLTGNFSRPMSVAAGADQKIYVADSLNHQVAVVDVRGSLLFAFGGYGNDYGEFSYPVAVALDEEGNILIADFRNGRVQAFDKTGKFLYAIAGAGQQKLRPTALAAGDKRIYVADAYSHQVVVFDHTGIEVARIGKGHGVETGFCNYPNGLALDLANGRIFVADSNNSRIQVFSLGGEFIKVLDGGGGLLNPRGLAYDSQNKLLYVADTLAHRLFVFDEDGKTVSLGQERSQGNWFSFPAGLSIMGSKLYVADRGNDRIVVFPLYRKPPLARKF